MFGTDVFDTVVLEQCLFELPSVESFFVRGKKKMSGPFRFVTHIHAGHPADYMGPVFADVDGNEYVVGATLAERQGKNDLEVFKIERPTVTGGGKPRKSTQFFEAKSQEVTDQKLKAALISLARTDYMRASENHTLEHN